MEMKQSRRDFMTLLGGAGVALSGGASNSSFAQPPERPQQTLQWTTIDRVDAAAVDRFIAGLKGRAIRPADGEYNASRLVWNAAVDKRPGLIAVCAGVDDVVRTIRFA